MWAFLSLILALSLDTFVAALSYETSKIKIPLTSNIIISFICALVLMVSLLVGHFLGNAMPFSILKYFSFIILLGIGLFKIFDNRVKNFIKKHNFTSKKINFSFCNLKFILQIYSDYEEADADKSKRLSSLEAISLALALSLDGFGAGLAFNIGFNYIIEIGFLCFLINIFFIFLSRVFTKICNKIKIDWSLIGGFIFIVIALSRI